MLTWLQANPIVILAATILMLSMAGRAVIMLQGDSTKKLIELLSNMAASITSLATSVEKNSENIDQLEVLYREQVTEIAKSVLSQEIKQINMSNRLEYLINLVENDKNGVPH